MATNLYCRLNTTTNALTSNSSYRGVFEDTNKFSGLITSVYSDVENDLYIDWIEGNGYTETTKQYKIFPFQPFKVINENHGRYFRCRLSNPSLVSNASITELTTRLTEVPPSSTKYEDKILWDSNIVVVNDTSNVMPCHHFDSLFILGNSSNASNITLQASHNGVNFYDSEYVISTSGSGDFGVQFPMWSPAYLRLKTDSNTTITAVVCGK